MKANYYIIYYDFGTWNKYNPHAIKSLQEAQSFAKEAEEKLNKPIDIIHEMWLDSLSEWPEPEFFKSEVLGE